MPAAHSHIQANVIQAANKAKLTKSTFYRVFCKQKICGESIPHFALEKNGMAASAKDKLLLFRRRGKEGLA